MEKVINTLEKERDEALQKVTSMTSIVTSLKAKHGSEIDQLRKEMEVTKTFVQKYELSIPFHLLDELTMIEFRASD